MNWFRSLDRKHQSRKVERTSEARALDHTPITNKNEHSGEDQGHKYDNDYEVFFGEDDSLHQALISSTLHPCGPLSQYYWDAPFLK